MAYYLRLVQWTGAASTAVHAFSSVAVNSDGWTLSATIANSKTGGTYSGLNSKSSPGLALTVTSKSWDTSGVQTTTTRTVYATAVKRQAYSNQALRVESTNGSGIDTTYTLSEYIYSTDTVTCAIASGFFTDNGAGGSGTACSAQNPAVANSSTEAYPLPQAVWLQHDLEWIQASTYSPKLAVMHRFGKSGQPVRAVKFIATDQHSNSVSAIATALSSGSWSASGLYANYFTASLDFSTLTQGDLCTIDAIIYPWVGDSYQISVSGETYPSANLSIYKVLNDRTGGFGIAYAYVDGVGGGTPTVSATAATAAANPYASIAAAAAAIQTFNNSTYSRNNISGGIIRIPAATTITGLGTDTMDTTLTDGVIPLQIEGINQSTSIYRDTGADTNNDINDKMKWKNLTFRKNGGSFFALRGDNSGLGDVLIFEDVIFDLNGQTIYDNWLTDYGAGYFINCGGSYCGQGSLAGGSKHGTALLLGCSWLPEFCFNAVACKDVNMTSTVMLGPKNTTSPLEALRGAFFGWNFVGRGAADTVVAQAFTVDVGTRGIALVGNIIEKWANAGTQPALQLWDTVTQGVRNVADVMNTIVGERTNVLYNDSGVASVLRNGLSKHTIHYKWNSKTDVFAANANCTGNWALLYKVGGGYSLYIAGGSDGSTAPGVGNWCGEISGPGDVFSGSADFVTDASTTGTHVGNGDYHLGGSTTAPLIPAGETYFAVDLFGTVIPTNGTAHAGAVQ